MIEIEQGNQLKEFMIDKHCDITNIVQLCFLGLFIEIILRGIVYDQISVWLHVCARKHIEKIDGERKRRDLKFEI
jgi:hypothetical protein